MRSGHKGVFIPDGGKINDGGVKLVNQHKLTATVDRVKSTTRE